MRRPIGVGILSVLYWLVGLYFLSVLVFGLLWLVDAQEIEVQPGWFAATSLSLLAATLLAWVSGWGLWGLHRWAWFLVMGLQILSILLNGTALIFAEPYADWLAGQFPEHPLFQDGEVLNVVLLSLIPIVINTLVLVYLLSPPLRPAFRVDVDFLTLTGVVVRERRKARDRPRAEEASSYCTNASCGRRLRPGWRHCPYCHSGTPSLEAAGAMPGQTDGSAASGGGRRCLNPACGRDLRPDWNVCPYCRGPQHWVGTGVSAGH